MNIPRRFKVGVRPHTVRLVRKLAKGETNGRTFLKLGAIELAERNSDGPRAPAAMEATFWHEAVHAILYDMGSALTNDEYFVDALAVRIHQITTTAEFDNGTT